ncbi:glycosyltransferase family 2 protein [Candidatus Dojkabacteria bacterium]|uniref:Glycosyltransferase family 2 protein n=1 Tax=Candidatus Dojkabacteria bacterium TaxID=2099670 RepID=A0A847CZ99_9BACT|nr:glycosyltransferase family 2 protein [Candidatus Dojkabacteria bacterium]
MQNPKVTVLMPAYNAEKYIETAIESILNQTYKDFEFIIVNDCSTDSTLDIIKKYAKKDKRIKIISNKENQKIAQTLNNGLKEAKGKYIARLDADDWSHPERLEKQVNFMEENPRIVLSSGNMEICDGELNKKNISNYPLSDKDIRKVFLQYNPTVSPAMIWRREVSEEIGGFSLNTMSEDYMFFMDMSSKGEVANLKDILIKYRVLDTSVSSTQMRRAHLSTVQIALTGFLKYGYTITFKTRLVMMTRFVTAFLIPPSIWRFFSSRIKR